jgi:parallel beta-helix repeat protein
MQKKFLVKGASVLLIIALIVPSIGAISANTTSQKATANTGITISMDKTWYVPDDFPTIQEAIDSDLVKDGDTIFVYSGIYNENVDLYKSVNLIGENKETTIIDGTGYDYYVVANIHGTPLHITISGFTIRNGNYGGMALGFCIGVTITDNIFTNNQGGCGAAIDFFRCTGNTITHNSIEYNDGGISLLYYSAGNIITDNSISNNNFSIAIGSGDPDWADGCTLNTVTGNTITNSGEYGIVIATNGNTIGGTTDDLKNVISYNPVGIWIHSGIYYRSALKKNNIFIDNDIHIEGGIKGRQSSRLILLLEKFPILERLLSLPIFIRLLNLR